MIILGTNSIKDTGYDVANSCRFNEASADSLHRATGETTGATNWTLSTWIKRSTLGSLDNGGTFLGWYTSTSKRSIFAFNDNDQLYWWSNSGSAQGDCYTTAVFRDVSAWYHVVLKIDTTQSSQSDRVKIYVNNVEQSLTFGSSYPTQNEANTGVYGSQYIGASYYNTGTDRHFGGYLAETVMIDDASLNPDQFGEFDEDSPTIWKPKDVSGLTFGSDGFYLDYEDSSALGNDAAGSNNLTVSNLTAIDQSTDTCTLNYATINPLNVPTSNQPTFSEGNLKTVSSSSASGAFGGSTTFGVSQGKWYVEAKATVGSTYSRNSIGVTYNPGEMARSNADTQISNTSYAWGWDSSGGDVYHDASIVASYATYATGDICQIFLDLDNHKLYFGKNGTLQSSTGISLDTGETYFIVQTDRTGSSEVSTFEFNFGAGTTFSISSGNTDGEYGNFEYSTTITGDGASKTFKALNSKNLAEYG